MKPTTERKILRWVHMILSIPILGHIYGPLEDKPYPAFATKFVFIPHRDSIWTMDVERAEYPKVAQITTKRLDQMNKFRDREMFSS